MTTALEGDEGSVSRPGRSLPQENTQYPLYRRLVGLQCRSGQLRKISPPPGFDPRTVQPIASRYTDYSTRPTIEGGLVFIYGEVCFIILSAADRLLRTKLAPTFRHETKLIFAAENRCGLQNLPGKKNVRIQNQTTNKSRNNKKKN